MCHGVGCSGDICNGSGLFSGPLACHARQLSIMSLAMASSPGNQIFSCKTFLSLQDLGDLGDLGGQLIRLCGKEMLAQLLDHFKK